MPAALAELMVTADITFPAPGCPKNPLAEPREPFHSACSRATCHTAHMDGCVPWSYLPRKAFVTLPKPHPTGNVAESTRRSLGKLRQVPASRFICSSARQQQPGQASTSWRLLEVTPPPASINTSLSRADCFFCFSPTRCSACTHA